MSLCGVESLCEVVIRLAFTRSIPKAIQNPEHAEAHSPVRSNGVWQIELNSRECRDPRMLQEELKLPIAAPFRNLLSYCVLPIECVPSVPSFRTHHNFWKLVGHKIGKSVYLSIGEGQRRSQNDNVKSSQLQVAYLASTCKTRDIYGIVALRWDQMGWNEIKWDELGYLMKKERKKNGSVCNL